MKDRHGPGGRIRRTFAPAPMTFIVALVTIACTPSPRGGIVLITVDTLRADVLGSYGGPVETPVMDAMAERGVLVERAYTPTPTTGPAHASLFTGLHPWRHRVLYNAVPLDETLPTLAEVLLDHGFRTAAFVSSYVLHPQFRFDRGFEDYRFEASIPFNFHGQYIEEFYARGDETTLSARRWLLENASSKERPFFLWLHYFDPHAPWAPPPSYRVPPNDPVDLRYKTVPRGVGGPRRLAQMIRAYRGEVRFVDAQVGRILETLRELDVQDRTTVILTSDHGEGLGDHGHLNHNANLYGELIHVPLIIDGPDLPRGRRLQGQAQLEDLFPTIVSLAGIESPRELDGVDLLPWIRGEQEHSPREVVLGRRQILRGSPDLYFQQAGNEKWIGIPSEAGATFDLARDTHEQSPREVDRLPSRLAESISDTLDDSTGGRPQEMDPRTRQALEALGYGEEPPSDASLP